MNGLLLPLVPKKEVNRFPRPNSLWRDEQEILMAQISDVYFQQFAGCYQFPDSFLVLDLETSGLDRNENLICSIGWCQVKDGQIVDNDEVYLDWRDMPGVDLNKLQADLDIVASNMLRKDAVLHHTYARLCSDGLPAYQVLQAVLERIEACENRREVIVGHNFIGFDSIFLANHFDRFLGVNWGWSPDLILDSGVLEKASQLKEFDKPLPMANETAWDWAKRIANLRRAGVYWSVSHCDKRYGLLAKLNMSTEVLHSAKFDSLLVAHLVQEYRRLASKV